MAKADLIERLNRVLHIEARSLIPYLSGISTPLLEAKGQGQFATLLRELRDEVQSEVTRLLELIDDQDGEADPGTYDAAGAYYNYLNPDYLIVLLRQMLEQHVAELDTLADQLQDNVAAEKLTRSFAENKRAFLEKLGALTIPERKAETGAKLKKFEFPAPKTEAK